MNYHYRSETHQYLPLAGGLRRQPRNEGPVLLDTRFHPKFWKVQFLSPILNESFNEPVNHPVFHSVWDRWKQELSYTWIREGSLFSPSPRDGHVPVMPPWPVAVFVVYMWPHRDTGARRLIVENSAALRPEAAWCSPCLETNFVAESFIQNYFASQGNPIWVIRHLSWMSIFL